MQKWRCNYIQPKSDQTHKFKIIEENAYKELAKETPQSFISIHIRDEELQTYAIFDFVDYENTTSYDLYTKVMSLKFAQINAIFQAYTDHQTKALGCCELQMYVCGLICGDKLFFTQARMQDMLIMLGRFWQR